MESLNKQISDFLRDSQYKLALMTKKMDDYDDAGDVYYNQLRTQRRELDAFYNLIFENSQAIEDNYNWLIAANWENIDILSEIHYLRDKYQLNGMPIIDYASVKNVINVAIPPVASQGSVPVPTASGQLLISVENTWMLGYLNTYGGMLETETINDYFTGRS